MMYWKQGFYDEPTDGSVEISEEYYVELLDGQSSGKEIKEEDGYPMLVEHEYHIEELRGMKVSEIRAHDKSINVNSFTLNGSEMWLNKATRVGLVSSIGIEVKAGRAETTIWAGGVKHVIPIPTAFEMLNKVELYAIDCNSTTQSHIAAVQELCSAEEIEMYDHTTGYPERLGFTV